jgi:hypothetical protein
MRWALAGTKLIEAGRRLSRYSVYSCPYCNGRVFLRIGHARDPHFAHYSGEGSLECEAYFPGQGYSGKPQIENRPPREVEDVPREAGLCLEDADDEWKLFVRVPEIAAEDLKEGSLSSLREAYLEVRTNGDLAGKMSALEMRPGAGSSRIHVVPSSHDYTICPVGLWPSFLDAEDWRRLKCVGLRPRGTLFRLRWGEWVRLRAGSPVESEEQLYLVTGDREAIPKACETGQPQVLTVAGRKWILRRLVLPMAPSPMAEDWLREIGHELLPPSWSIKIVSVPEKVGLENGIQSFSLDSPVVAKVSAPRAGAHSHISIDYGTNRNTSSLQLEEGQRDAFISVTASGTGAKSIRIAHDRSAAIEFHIVEPMTLVDLRETLKELPKLRLSIDGEPYYAWSKNSAFNVASRRGMVRDVRIDAGVEQAVLALDYRLANRRIVRSELSVGEAEVFIGEALASGTAGELLLDSYGLGSIRLALEVPPADELPTNQVRIARWIACTSACESESVASLRFGLTRELSRNPILAVTASRDSRPATAMQIRALVARWKSR